MLGVEGATNLVILVPGLDELLGRLEVLEGDALRRPPRLPHQLGVRLPLRLGLVVAHRRHVRPKKTFRDEGTRATLSD